MKKKQGVITFKVDEDFNEAIKDIPNRSAFIRSAIAAALGSTCPLCNGRGILTPKQKRHWDGFAVKHPIKSCRHYHENMLICSNT